ncbi:MAG: glycine--tRNA ligase subunit beta [Thermoanaerobaculia bacterium]
MPDYFFEIVAEEIPAWMHDAAQSALKESLQKLCTDLGATTSDVIVNSTPRRIAFVLPALPEREEDREQDVKGPPKKSAYDASGNPTAALQGFLRKNEASISDVLDAGDEYVRIRKRIAGRNTDERLRERVPQIIESLRWPKMMRWGSGNHSWIRPVHSVLSLLGETHVPIEVFGVASSLKTVGHRTLAPRPIEVHSYNEYVTKLELARVVVDALRRRHVMAERARVLAMQVGGTPSLDATIWSQWQYLTEYPGVLRAEFRKDYLSLPEEVLVTVMRVHQKQLPVRNPSGALTNSFLAVIDNEADPDGNAAYGNSFVTNARFADAKFFYETDRRRPLADRLERLTHLQFQEKLGNYLEKSKRIERIAAAICGELKVEPGDVVAAARLCKADLVTEMVKEFTDLQGKIGGIYAREEGQPDGVWQAIYDHYLPLNLDDELPRTPGGAIVSIADKIDTLVGFFSVGMRPTGSRDPFGLRRAAQGVVQILLNRDKRQLRIGVDRLIDIAGAAYGTGTAERVKTDLLEFLAERVRTLLETSRYELAYDEIAAAMEAGWASSLTDLVERVQALKAMRNQANFLSVLDAAKRIANITAGHETGRVDPALLEHDAEKRLNTLASEVRSQIEELIGERHYRQALESFAGMAPELENFFDQVMVMVDNEAVRRNRMSLLRGIGDAVTRVADVTKIVVDRSDYRA